MPILVGLTPKADVKVDLVMEVPVMTNKSMHRTDLSRVYMPVTDAAELGFAAAAKSLSAEIRRSLGRQVYSSLAPRAKTVASRKNSRTTTWSIAPSVGACSHTSGSRT